MVRLIENLQPLHNSKTPYVLVTLTQVQGSAPQIEGAKIVVTSHGLHWGTIGGGAIEAAAIAHAQDLLRGQDKPKFCVFNLRKDLGMACGGEVSLFFDLQKPLAWHVAVFGAGHTAQELCRVLSSWSCQVSVFETRQEWLERLPSSANIEKRQVEDMASEVAQLPDGTFLLSLTQGFGTDVPILFEAVKDLNRFSMVGVIGSSVKIAKIRSELTERGADHEAIQKIVCPLGLPIGDNTPPEIAISICSQILAIREKATFRLEGGRLD
jgi:xanthine dehydrogenase accessory factor